VWVEKHLQHQLLAALGAAVLSAGDVEAIQR
jgi:hypothetical protein